MGNMSSTGWLKAVEEICYILEVTATTCQRKWQTKIPSSEKPSGSFEMAGMLPWAE
jgi:hypothetical protein